MNKINKVNKIKKLTMAENLRIHISPVGFEFKRVTVPLIQMQADKVYLITYKKNDDATKFFSRIKSELRRDYKHIQVEEVFLDIWNLYECIAEFRSVISKEEGNHIYVNVSTGTKITAIAGMLSCMLWKAIPYYAPVSYTDKKTQDLPSEQVQDPHRLHTYEIKKPKPEWMKILELLDSRNGTMRKSEIIKSLEGMQIIRQKDCEGRELKGPAKHNQLRTLLDPMESGWKYVEVKSSGSRSEVTITEQGKNALQIFGCMEYIVRD